MSARPPPLALADILLASTISLPHSPSICYVKLSPSRSESVRKPHEEVEFVRRHVLTLNSSSTLLDSLLTSVHTSPPRPYIYVFAISSRDQLSAAVAKLRKLHFDFMIVNENGSFTPKDVYACSSACSFLEAPCVNCHSQTPHTFVPRKSFRAVHSHFLEAVRIRLLDDIVKVSYRRERSTSPHKQVQRLKGGFLFGRHPAIPRQNEWEHHSSTRPLVFCHLHVLLAEPLDYSPHLIIHPILMATPYVPLMQAFPLPSGTPIVLLPHGTPAYYRTTYAGPTGALIKQFKEALQGLGASNWEDVFNENPSSGQRCSQDGNIRDPIFIIAQINVENRQGADRGVLIIYPTALCLFFIPSMANQCQPLEHMLELPTPLQPSPEVQHSTSHIRSSLLSANSWHLSGVRKQVYVSPTNFLTNDSLQAFRSLSLLRHKDIHRVADEVSVYVESVARERERERERLKREREGTSSSPRLTRPAAPTPVAASTTPSNDIPDQVSSAEVGPLLHQSVSVPQVAPIPPNSFYPSPPHVNPGGLMIPDETTSPTADKSPSPTDGHHVLPTDAIQTTSTCDIHQISKSSSSSFDPFGNIDSAWSENYIDMDLDFDMSISFGMSENSNDREAYMDTRRNADFEDVFTDDDFSFFDQPSRSMASNRSITPSCQIPTLQALTSTEPLRTDVRGANVSIPFREEFLSGPRAVSIRPSWASQQTEGLLPALAGVETRVPDLLPPSGESPDTDSEPTTPDVQLSTDMISGNTQASLLKSLFDPIPFAPYHRVADGKYLQGKFALSSPKGEEYPPKVPTLVSTPGETGGWKLRYNAITDPRIGVVQKLIGVKRKLELEHISREIKFLPSWTLEDDWAVEQQSEEEYARSDNESEEEGEIEDTDSNNGISRPATPPPSYLPLGPSLLCTRFEHDLLLSVGMPFRPSDAARNTPAPISVPTPVSPAAVLGVSTEKTKSLEAVANAVATEVVENSLWADAWKSFTSLAGTWTDIWPADIKYASTLLNSVSSPNILNLASLFSIQGAPKAIDDVLKPLEPPMISIGKGNAVIYVLPTALRFWDKLGLGPRGGRKNLMVFVLYDNEGAEDQRELQVNSFLSSIVALYSARNYGSLTLGQHPSCAKDGHLPVKYDKSLRKTITSFISQLAPTEQHYVLFLVIPVSIMTLASSVLRQVIAALKKSLKGRTNVHAIYELVPEHRIFGSLQTPNAHELSIDSLCSSIYDKTPSIVNRFASRDLLDSGNIQSYIEEPAFTLSRPLPGKVSFSREAQASLDVMDRYTFMHIGYQLSICGKWLVAACIDQRGEAHDIGIWLSHSDNEGHEDVEMNDYKFTVMKVLEFALSFAKRANVEWRITITKYGIMEEVELDAWICHLKDETTRSSSPLLHVFVLCTEAEAPWSVVNPRHTTGKPQRGSGRAHATNVVYTDVSSHIYMLRTRIKVPISLPARTPLCQPFVPEVLSDTPSTVIDATAETTEDKQQTPHPLTMLPCSSMTLVFVPSSAPSIPISMLHIHLLYTTFPGHPEASLPDNLHEEITYNFYELSCLAKLRWKLHTDPNLPFHLGAVQVMQSALERDKDKLEGAVDG